MCSGCLLALQLICTVWLGTPYAGFLKSHHPVGPSACMWYSAALDSQAHVFDWQDGWLNATTSAGFAGAGGGFQHSQRQRHHR